jgi:hypothetical protein
MTIEEIISDAESQNIIVVPMILPRIIYDFLNNAAIKRGKTVGSLINEIFFSRIKEMANEDLPQGAK